MATKLLPANVTIWAVYPSAFDAVNPSAAALNDERISKNISCAIEDGYSLNMVDSDTDDSRTICDIGEVSTPTFYNYEASLDGFRDADLDANGVFNLFYDLFKVKGIPYFLVKRIGYPNSTPAEEGQDISIYEVVTDNPEDILSDGEMQRLGARFKTSGNLHINTPLNA